MSAAARILVVLAGLVVGFTAVRGLQHVSSADVDGTPRATVRERPAPRTPREAPPPEPTEPPACEPPDEAALCQAWRVARLEHEMRALQDHGYGPRSRPVGWEDVTEAEVDPQEAEQLADAWAKRCLVAGAWSTLRCEEYPCVLGVDVADVLDPACLNEGAQGVGQQYDMRPGVSFATVVFDRRLDPRVADAVRGRAKSRMNQIILDWAGRTGAR